LIRFFFAPIAFDTLKNYTDIIVTDQGAGGDMKAGPGKKVSQDPRTPAAIVNNNENTIAGLVFG
jgi:hypothetical protein